MAMTDEQLRRLAKADRPTVTLCYHGLSVEIADRDRSGIPSMFRIRFIGHMTNTGLSPEESDETVPEHREFSIDIPVMLGTMSGILDLMLNAVEGSETPPKFNSKIRDDWMRVVDVPGFLEDLFRLKPRHDDDDHDGGEST